MLRTDPSGGSWLSGLRDGSWLTAERCRVYGRMLVAFYLAISVVWLALSHEGLDPTGKPIGPDFLNVYAAGVMANEGRPAAAYDWAEHGAVEQSVLPHDGYYGWHYPPPFLALAAPLARLPYLWALAVYMAASLLAYGLAMAVLAGRAEGLAPRREVLVLALAFPAVFVNLGHGQNGFLTAALVAGAVASYDRRPVVAGVLIGLLAYKPQFGLLIPVALVAARAWRTVAAATITVVLMALASAWAFGIDTWTAFAGSWHLTRVVVLEEGATGWEKIVSLFSAIRAFGAPVAVAYAVQFAGAAVAAVVVALVWFRPVDPGRKWAVLILALPLGTPYVLDYDLTVLAPAIAALAFAGLADGFAPWRKSLVAILYLMPLVSRQIGMVTHLPVMQAALVAVFVLASVDALRAPPYCRRLP